LSFKKLIKKIIYWLKGFDEDLYDGIYKHEAKAKEYMQILIIIFESNSHYIILVQS